jgi:hypothetical protein
LRRLAYARIALAGGSRQLHVVHNGGLAGIVDEQFQRLSDEAPSLVNGAALCVAAAYPAHRGDPPARFVSLVSHAISLHRFFNSGSGADVVWFGARDGDHTHSYFNTLEHRNDAQRAPSACLHLSTLLASEPKVRGSLIVESGDFPVEFAEGDGLKNRCGFERKSWIRQVLISRTLTVCGEVAERLKAAVC